VWLRSDSAPSDNRKDKAQDDELFLFWSCRILSIEGSFCKSLRGESYDGSACSSVNDKRGVTYYLKAHYIVSVVTCKALQKDMHRYIQLSFKMYVAQLYNPYSYSYAVYPKYNCLNSLL